MSKWIIDTNILCHWIMSYHVLPTLVKHFKLSDEFLTVYKNRYSDSCNFLEEVKKQPPDKHSFFIDELSMSELFSAIRNEVRAIVLFVDGVPIAKWSSEREHSKGIINEQLSRNIMENTNKGIDSLVNDYKISIIESHTASSDKNYIEVYSSLIFLHPELKTQDAMLLCSAAFERLNFFATTDNALVRLNSKLSDKLKFSTILPSTAIIKLKSKKQ